MDTPSIYVGTYSKYNSGSIAGKWLDLTDYTDLKDFYSACAELHKDEHDPEFMFQDWENIPSQYIGESWLSDDLFSWLETIENSHLDAEVFEAAAELDISHDEVEDAYRGTADNHAEFAEEFYYEIHSEEALGPLHRFIDWDAVWSCELSHDFVEHDGHYFWRH